MIWDKNHDIYSISNTGIDKVEDSVDILLVQEVDGEERDVTIDDNNCNSRVREVLKSFRI